MYSYYGCVRTHLHRGGNMEESLQGGSLLTEDDFNDVAATVGEGLDGSDDEASSDDFLSWLLVHADTIDPTLNLDEDEAGADAATPEVNAAAGERSGTNSSSSTNAVESLQEYPGGGLSTILGTVASPPESSLAPAEGTAVASGGLAPSIMPPSSTAHTWGIAGAVGAVGVGAGDYAGGEGGAPAAASYLHGQLEAAGGIPSDPVLAMQMGARMALAGNLNLIPFGMGNGAGIAGADASTVVAPAPLRPDEGGAASTPTGTNCPAQAPTTHTAVLPARSSLPPPPEWSKVEQSKPPIAVGVSSTGEAFGTRGGAVRDGSAVGVLEAGLAGLGSGTDGANVGDKRPRASSTAGESKPGRDTLKDGRRRKRMSAAELEERVKQVSEDSGRLKLHLSNVNDKLKLMATRKKAMEAEIAAKLDAQRSVPSEANTASLAEALSRFKDLYADYGAQRKQEVEFHLKQLERLIVPTDTTKMSLWTLEQDESFYKDRKRGSLSFILRDELGVSEEQIVRIQERRTRIKSLLAELRESLRLVKNLQKSSEAKNAKFEEVMARLQSSFSPQQIARLLLWVSTNRAHISKLPLLPKDTLQQRALLKHEA